MSTPREPIGGSIEGLLAEYTERREAGEAIDPEAFAREHPEAGTPLLRALDDLRRTESLFPAGDADRPERVGPYRVLGEMGRGGMGRVLRVEDERAPGRELALKLLHGALEDSPRALERFRREGDALRRTRHPGLVRVLDAGVAGSRPFLVMELVDGTGLAEIVARSRRGSSDGGERASAIVSDPTSAARLAAAVARAMERAHEHGVLHRDLNPRNVLVRPDGQPVVVDFGLTRAEGLPTLTGTGDMLGTPPYMAPEQAQGRRADERTDVWGVGAILFELLTLRPPRSADTTLAAVREAASRPVPSARRFARSVPRDLDTIVRRALSYRREWRYPTMAELADDLERFVRSEPVAARRPGPIRRAHDAWLRHPRLLSGALVLVAAAVALLVATSGPDPLDLETRLSEAHAGAVVGWLEGELDVMRGHTATLSELAPDDPFVPYFAALADGRLLERSADAVVQLLVRGERARRAGRLDEALEHFQAAWDLGPGSPVLLMTTGLAAREAGDLALAESCLERVARSLYASPTLHRTLSEVYLGRERFVDAVRAAEIGLQLAPEDPTLWWLLAEAKVERGDEAAFLSAVDEALRLGGADAVPALAARLEERGHVASTAALRERVAAAAAGSAESSSQPP